MNNPLFIEKAYLNGQFITHSNTFEVINPSNNKVIGSLPNLTKLDCKEALDAADKAWKTWREVPLDMRVTITKKLFELIHSNKENLAEIMTLESGKPLQESLGEVAYANSFVEWFAEEGKRSYGETIPSLNNNTSLVTIKQGLGVVGAITPWNFPLAMITRKLAPALVAGCTVVLKPASQTPFTAIALAKLTELAGVPKGVFSVITSKESLSIGEELATNPLVRKITFTGSTEVGASLMKYATSTIKRISLELGGNAPFIVFEDADIDNAVLGAIAGKFRNSGQTCVSINRFYVQESIYQQFVDKLTEAVQKLKVADGFEPGSQVGPLINQKAIQKVQHHVEDAIQKGAIIQTGGKVIHGNFFEPTVLSNMPKSSLVSTEETFGPICAIFKFKTEQEVLKLANETPFGLAAYFYSENIKRCMRVAESLESGMIGINTGLISNASAPFGGVKQSGLGREGSKYGLDEYMEIKYLCFGR